MRKLFGALFFFALLIPSCAFGQPVPGVLPYTCATHQWANQLSETGTTTCLQPNFTDLSGGSSFWPTLGTLLVSGNPNSPTGVAEVDGLCAKGVGGSWTTSSCGGAGSIGTAPLIEDLPNNASGTTLNKTVIYTSSGNVETSLTSSTNNGVGICTSPPTGDSSACGTTGDAPIAIEGQVPCVFDGATTAGDFVIASTTVAGDCHDSGSGVNVPANVQVYGFVLSTHASGGTYSVDLNPVGVAGANSAKARPSGSDTDVQYNNSNAFGGNSGFVYDKTSKITLGVSGTSVGAVALNNATSGSVTISPTTGALGTVTATLPANTGTVAELNLAQSFTAGQAVTPTVGGTQSAGGTYTPDFSASNSVTLTFGAGNLTIANPTNIKAGQTYIISLTQDATGGRTVTWGADYKWGGGTPPTLSTAANAKDVISCWTDTTTTINCTLAVKGAA